MPFARQSLPLSSDGYSSSLLLPPPCEKPSVLTVYFQPPYAKLVSRKVEVETDESGEQAIMEERVGGAFAGSEHLTVIGRRLHPGVIAPDFCLNYLDLVDREWHLLQRSVVVIDRTDRIVYVEYITDRMSEPNYTAAIQAVQQAAEQ